MTVSTLLLQNKSLFFKLRASRMQISTAIMRWLSQNSGNNRKRSSNRGITWLNCCCYSRLRIIKKHIKSNLLTQPVITTTNISIMIVSDVILLCCYCCYCIQSDRILIIIWFATLHKHLLFKTIVLSLQLIKLIDIIIICFLLLVYLRQHNSTSCSNQLLWMLLLLLLNIPLSSVY